MYPNAAANGLAAYVRGREEEPFTVERDQCDRRRPRVEASEIMNFAAWQPVELEAEYCAEAVPSCANASGGGKAEMQLRVKKHLLALGWKIEGKRDSGVRFRYHSPDGKIYYSLHKVCCDLMGIQEAKKDPMCMEGIPLPYGIMEASSSSAPATSFLAAKSSREEISMDNEEILPECIPEAIQQYKDCMDSMRRQGSQKVASLVLKRLRFNAKKHLLFMGWNFWLKDKKTRQELRYESPRGKSYISLYRASQGYLVERPQEASASWSTGCRNKCGTSHRPSACVAPINEHSKKKSAFSAGSFNSEEFGCGKQCWREDREANKIRVDSDDRSTLDQSLGCRPQPKRRKASQASTRRGHGSEMAASTRGWRSSKQSRSVTVSSHGRRVKKTVLVCLMNNDVVMPREKASYVRKRDGRVMKDGRITRDGIKCNCCSKIFSVANFEAHSGGSGLRPAPNIFLKDGRSLLQCEVQMMMHANKSQEIPHKRVKGDYSEIPADGVCSVCHEGGDLMLCDHCPSSFHPGCVGLDEAPEGNWFCSSCHCGICGLSEFNSDSTMFTEKTMLYCDQCEREYHAGCSGHIGLPEPRSCPMGNWFCSKRCTEIFRHLRRLLGKVIPTSKQGLSCSILRANGFDDIETKAKHHSKLCIALDILHECFVTIIEARTQRDFVADLLFNEESELRRLNFWGFYTMIVQKEDEVISVATFRILGEKVAEMPLVGTRVDCRRQGMCRLLVDELEKLLSSLGVERLILPAVPQLLQTWTGSFGFRKMESSERSKLLEYIVLNFQDTTLCQKIL